MQCREGNWQRCPKRQQTSMVWLLYSAEYEPHHEKTKNVVSEQVRHISDTCFICLVQKKRKHGLSTNIMSPFSCSAERETGKDAQKDNKLRWFGYFILQSMSHIMRKPKMWFPNRSDTNQVVQAQNMVRDGHFGFRNQRNCTIRVAKTKALISFAVTAKLIYVFVFAYIQIVGFQRLSHYAAQIIF